MKTNKESKPTQNANKTKFYKQTKHKEIYIPIVMISSPIVQRCWKNISSVESLIIFYFHKALYLSNENVTPIVFLLYFAQY